MEKVTYYAAIEGISLEHMVRYGKFDMRVKHFHTEYEIFYILEGERLFFFNNRNFVASKGDLILVNTNLIHMTKSVSAEDAGHNRIILYVTLDKMKELDEKYPTLNLVRFFGQNYGVYHLDEEQQGQFMNLYYLFKKEYKNRSRNYKQAIELAVTSYFLNISRSLNQSTQELPLLSDDGKYRRVYGIADYLSENCEQDISLEDLASQFFLSKYYICRLFKELTGYTIREYVNIHRIQKAKQLLEESDYSVSKIAELVGYGSLTHFEQIFKTHMTMSPMKYRKARNLFVTNTPPMNP